MGKGHPYWVINLLIVVYVLMLLFVPSIFIGSWYFLSGDILLLVIFLFFPLLMEYVIVKMLRVFRRNYYYEYYRSDLIVYDDRIQLSIPNIQIRKDMIKAIILEEDDFLEHMKTIASKMRQKFFKIANNIPVEGVLDLKKYFLQQNAVIILHEDPRDRLGIQLIDNRYHRNLDEIKFALIQFMAGAPSDVRRIMKEMKHSSGDDILTIRSRYDSRSNGKILLKVIVSFVLTISIVAALFLLDIPLVPEKARIMVTALLSVFLLFQFAMLLGSFTQRAVAGGTKEYTIDGTYIKAQIVPQLGYHIPLKHILSVRKLPADFNSNFRNLLKYDRSAGHIPMHNFENPFMIKLGKGVWPRTKLGGARPHTVFILGDDAGRSGYWHIKKYLKKRKENSRAGIEVRIGKRQKRTARLEATASGVTRIGFSDRRGVSRNIG
ncbi:MAG: hypothetical protein ACMUHB_02260, partial [Thermoplasmatota archaeon]